MGQAPKTQDPQFPIIIEKSGLFVQTMESILQTHRGHYTTIYAGWVVTPPWLVNCTSVKCTFNLFRHSHVSALNSPKRVCNSPVPKRCDSRQDNRTLAVTEHVGIEASAGQTWVVLAHCHTTRWVAESAGSKVNTPAAVTHLPDALHCTTSWTTAKIKIVLNKNKKRGY